MRNEAEIRNFVDAAPVFHPDDGWLTPDMSIVDGHSHPAPSLDLSVFGEWESWIAHAAASKSAPPDYVASALLAIAGGALGNARWVSPWEGWSEPPIIWTALVGRPSSRKSPALDAVASLAYKLETELAEDFPTTLCDYETKKAMAKAVHDNWLEDVKTAQKNGAPAPVMPETAIEPDEPQRPRLIVSDATIEAVGTIHSGNPKGLVLYRDELAGFLTGMDRYSGGGDRGFWLEAFGGRPYIVDRKKSKTPISIPYLSTAIVGCIQPDRLQTLIASGDDDGLSARILMSWPDPMRLARPTAAPDNCAALAAIHRLYSLRMDVTENGHPTPRKVRLDSGAVSALIEFGRHIEGLEADTTGLELSALGKMPGYAIRLALILEYLNWAMRPGESEPTHASEASYRAALDLVDEYYIPMMRRCLGDAARPVEYKAAATLARHIQQNGIDRFNARSARREWGLPGLRKASEMKAAIEVLVDAQWLRVAWSRDGETPGRSREDYIVNPHVHEAE